MYIKSYKELIVWQKSIQLVKEVFILTENFPKSELYGFTSQMRRAAISIPSNIAEGSGRNSIRENIHACAIAYGSALELETQIIISKELKFNQEDKYLLVDQLLDEVLKMLNSMKAKMKQLAANN